MLKFLMRRQSPWWSAGHAATRALWMLDKVPSTSLSSEQIGVCNWRLIRQASSSIIWVTWSIIEFIKASLSCLGFKENLVKSKHEPKKERAQVSPLDSKKKAIKHIKPQRKTSWPRSSSFSTLSLNSLFSSWKRSLSSTRRFWMWPAWTLRTSRPRLLWRPFCHSHMQWVSII